MKALELVVHPPQEPDDTLFWRDTSTGRQYSAPVYRLPSGILSNRPPHPRECGKRLTDPELAAEHHAAALDVYRAKVHGRGADWELNLKRLAVLRRFATHDHYDEVTE